jgi:hypothetical protein
VLELAGPLAIASVVLAVGGVYKLRAPGPTAAALTSLGFPSSPWTVRTIGVIEISIGVGAALVGGRVLAMAVAVLYMAFAVVAWRLARHPSGASCGCFGNHSAESTGVHVIVNLIVAAVAAAAALADAPGALTVRHESPLGGVLYLALVALGSWLLTAMLTVLPDALVAARRSPAATTPVKTFEISGSAR